MFDWVSAVISQSAGELRATGRPAAAGSPRQAGHTERHHVRAQDDGDGTERAARGILPRQARLQRPGYSQMNSLYFCSLEHESTIIVKCVECVIMINSCLFQGARFNS